MLTYLLYGIFILSCLVLIVAVLLQPGKADAGNLFTSSFSSTAFGPRGTQTLLAKITIGAAITFMLAALLLTTGLGEQRSLMEGADATATPAASPAASPAAPPQAETAPAAASPQAEGAASPAVNTNAGASASPAASPAAQASPETK